MKEEAIHRQDSRIEQWRTAQAIVSQQDGKPRRRLTILDIHHARNSLSPILMRSLEFYATLGRRSPPTFCPMRASGGDETER
jgi:hypothetical protein